MRRTAIILILLLAACSSSAKPATSPSSAPGTTVAVTTDKIPALVQDQLEPGDTASEVAPGVWERASDKLLLGACDVVKPYAKAHGKPGGYFCW